MTALVVIEGVVILMLVVLVAGLLRSHAEILRKLDDLGAGEGHTTQIPSPRPKVTGLIEAPSRSLTGQTPSGSQRTVELSGGRVPTLLGFLSTGCSSCQVFWNALGPQQRIAGEDARVVIITKGADGESPSKVKGLAPAGVTIIMSSDVWDEFKVPLTPHFMLVDPRGRIVGEGSATSLDQLTGLLERSIADMGDPRRMGTAERAEFTDERLAESGVDPNHPSLYEDPLDR